MTHLARNLEVLERELLALSSIAEEMIAKACRALNARDAALAQGVIEQDEIVNQREVVIEEECLKLLALHQPVAIDLRRTAAILKINNDLERIADLAVNIAERAQALVAHAEFPIPATLAQMSERSIAMVHKSLDAFVKLDLAQARQVCADDEAIDDLYRQTIGQLLEQMQRDPRVVEPAYHCLSAARHMERIADHATNIGEDAIYLVNGEIARHAAR